MDPMKIAHDAGVAQALADYGIVKNAGDKKPETKSESKGPPRDKGIQENMGRAVGGLAGGGLGLVGGSTLGAGLGSAVHHLLGTDHEDSVSLGALLGALGGTGAGAYLGHGLGQAQGRAEDDRAKLLASWAADEEAKKGRAHP
jgi:hypothetical protein